VAPPLTPEEFAELAGVSRETLARLKLYADLLLKWQRTLNLVGASSLSDLWRRHMLDSAQLFPLLPGCDAVTVDLGSGAGFPGLVLAALGATSVHLIESDGRKCVFLAEAARAMGLGETVSIHRDRIEAIKDLRADVVLARACAPLSRMLELAEKLLSPATVCLFLKGANVEDELTLAGKHWRMNVERLPSVSDPSGTILRIGQIRRGEPIQR
jgi:16S rRNA (guanine527-N7)-methyltransferase